MADRYPPFNCSVFNCNLDIQGPEQDIQIAIFYFWFPIPLFPTFSTPSSLQICFASDWISRFFDLQIQLTGLFELQNLICRRTVAENLQAFEASMAYKSTGLVDLFSGARPKIASNLSVDNGP